MSNFSAVTPTFHTMVQTPIAIQKLFSNFPLVQYPPIPNSTPSSKADIAKNTYFFTGGSSDASFLLGCHNVISAEFSGNTKFICSDPVSFAQALILAEKNGLKLPTPASTSSPSPHGLLRLSHHASANNQLPVLIETSKEHLRTIRSCDGTNSIISANMDPQEKLVNHLVDVELYDAWILNLLGDVITNDITTFSKIFAVEDNIKESPSLYQMTLISILQHLIPCNSFKIRYPSLFDEGSLANASLPLRVWHRGWMGASTVENSRAFDKVFEDALQKVDKILSMLVAYVNEHPESKIIKLKVVAFFVVVSEVVPESKLGLIVSKYGYFKKSAYETIASSF